MSVNKLVANKHAGLRGSRVEGPSYRKKQSDEQVFENGQMQTEHLEKREVLGFAERVRPESLSSNKASVGS